MTNLDDNSLRHPLVSQVTSDDDPGQWEDVDDINSESLYGQESRMTSPAPSSPAVRRRAAGTGRTRAKGASGTVPGTPGSQHKATSRTKLPKASPDTPPVPHKQQIPLEQFSDALANGSAFTARYIFDVVGGAISLLRKPLTVALFLYILLLIITHTFIMVRQTFAPLCFLPGISSTAMCAAPPPYTPAQEQRKADWQDLVDVQSRTFEQLFDDTAAGSGLALEIKKAEMASSDLATVVRVSDLRSKELIADTLSEFIDDAKATGRALQKLTSRVGGSVDSVFAINDYALHTIEAAAPKSNSLLSVLWPFPSPPPGEVATKEMFTQVMDVLSTTFERLILEAEVSYSNLEKLEERLSVMHELLTREDKQLNIEKDELLAQLWSILGGNQDQIKKFDRNFLVLKNLSLYRKKARVHVVSALQTLHAMKEDMDDLRERAAAPELTGSKVPLEVHIKSIAAGLERLKNSRAQARKREDETVRRVLALDAE